MCSTWAWKAWNWGSPRAAGLERLLSYCFYTNADPSGLVTVSFGIWAAVGMSRPLFHRERDVNKHSWEVEGFVVFLLFLGLPGEPRQSLLRSHLTGHKRSSQEPPSSPWNEGASIWKNEGRPDQSIKQSGTLELGNSLVTQGSVAVSHGPGDSIQQAQLNQSMGYVTQMTTETTFMYLVAEESKVSVAF